MRHLQLAAQNFKQLIDVQILDYAHILQTPERISDHLRPGSWLKIDSPGEDPQAQNFFIQQGWQHQQEQHPQHPSRPLNIPQEYGNLMASDDWYHGYALFLKTLEKHIPAELNIQWINTIPSILLMTDKWHCQQHFLQHHIPVPPLLGRICDYDEFKTLLQQHPAAQVFIKARYGSSASGVIAYRHNSRNGHSKQQATSTTIFQNGQPFNSKRVRQYIRENDIATLINTIAQYDAYVEAWIPKPKLRLENKNLSFDFRTLMLGGTVRHEIIRASTHPMTNLHLDSHRIPPENIAAQYNQTHMHHILQQAAGTLPSATIIGFDAIATPQKTWVLEANAFGDLLLNVQHQGQTTYEAQLAYILQQALQQNLQQKATPCST